jgi:fatty acid desaturase
MNRSPALLDVPPHALPAARSRNAERSSSLFRHSAEDAWLLLCALAQGLLTAATVPFVLFAGLKGAIAAAAYLGVSLWWCSNTVAHNHLHSPLFRSRRWNAVFSAFLSVALGVPQTLWRARHLAHHAGDARRRKRTPLGVLFAVEVGLIAGSWIGLAILSPSFLLLAYAPGYALGMTLSALQGYYEHKAEIGEPGSGVSYYGRLYNLLWFNDGYHVEHHRFPAEHWTRLPARRRSQPRAAVSASPPVLRWFELFGSLNRLQAGALGLLEQLVLRSDALQRFVIARHERAFRALLPALGERPLRRVGIVGGGMFPRTVVVLRRLLPESELIVLDHSAHNIELARRYLSARGHGEQGVEFREARFEPGSCPDFDLLVTPLALVGEKEALYTAARATPLLIHDWIWRSRGDHFAIVSVLLLKQLNLVLGKQRNLP